MTQFRKGADALADLQPASNEGGGNLNKTDFAKFGVGTTYKVRALGTLDFMTYVGYGIYGKVSTFAAKTPSIRDKRGFVVDNHTPWDLAEKHYRELQMAAKESGNEAEMKKHQQEAGKYRGGQRFVMGFVDLKTGKEILVDLSKPQAAGIHSTLVRYEKKLGKLAFELSKTNATGEARDTKVSLTPIIDFEEDLTEEEQANFKKFDDKEFDLTLFDGLVYEADEKEQIENLVAAGFDVSLIGLSIGANNGRNSAQQGEEDPTGAF